MTDNTAPTGFLLKQNYPNPFNPSTVIQFQVASRGFVSLKVYDVAGREVATLVNENKSPGNYSVVFDAGNLASGMYVYRLEAGSFRAARKMLVTK